MPIPRLFAALEAIERSALVRSLSGRRPWGAKSRPRAVVGVDADGSGARLVAVERRGASAYRLVGVVRAAASGSGAAAPEEEERGPSLREALDRLKGLGIRCVAGIPADESTIGLFRAADVPQGDRESALRFVLEKIDSEFPSEDSIVAEWEAPSPGGEPRALVAGCGTAAAETAVGPLVAAGRLSVSAVPEALALEAIARLAGAIPADGSTIAVVHAGASRSLLAVVGDAAGVLFQRPLRVARVDLETALAQTLALGPDETLTLGPGEAAEVLRLYEIGQSEPVPLPNGRSVPAELVVGLLRPDLERLVLEIAKSLRHFERAAPAAPPSALRLSGALAELKGLDRYLEEKLRIPVGILNPLEGVALDLSVGSGVEVGRDRLSLALAIGLAVDGAERLDLSPKSLRRSRLERGVRRSFRLAAAAAVTIVVALGIVREANVRGLEQRIAGAKSIHSTLLPHAEALLRRDAERVVVRLELARREAAVAGTAPAAPILREILSSAGPAIYFDSLSIEPAGGRARFALDLATISPGAEDEALFIGERFVSAISASPLLSEVTTSSDSASERRGGYPSLRFRVEGNLERGARREASP